MFRILMLAACLVLANHDLYTEIKFDQTPPAEPRTYDFAFFVRFDRRDGRDI